MKTIIENILNAAQLTKANPPRVGKNRKGYDVRAGLVRWYSACGNGYDCPCEVGTTKNVAAIKAAIEADGRFEVTDSAIDWVAVRER